MTKNIVINILKLTVSLRTNQINNYKIYNFTTMYNVNTFNALTYVFLMHYLDNRFFNEFIIFLRFLLNFLK